MAAPNAVDATITWRTVTLMRRAVASAPSNEPKLRIENNSVKLASLPPNVRVTNSGNTTWKLNDSVPTIVTITSGIQRSGVAAHVAEAGPHLALAARCDRRRPQLARAHQPVRRDHRDVRDAVDREAPSEPADLDEHAGERGPDHARAHHHRAVEAHRVGTYVSGTISTTNDRRAGLSNAVAKPAGEREQRRTRSTAGRS